MFSKPFRVKSNNQVKGSERKNVKELIQKSFPSLSESDLETLMPKKEVLNSVKVVLSNEETVQVFTVQKRPIVFSIRNNNALFPTVYMLWKFPDLLHAFTTHTQVLRNIINGADLMLPGVMTPPSQPKYGNLAQNQAAAINTSDNVAAFAVGVTVMDSASMASGRGRCLTVYHYHGDKLCCLEGLAALPIPQLGPPQWLQRRVYNEDFPALGERPRSSQSLTNPVSVNIETLEQPSNEAAENVDDSPTEPVPKCTALSTEEMDQLLTNCFFAAIKYSKTLTLPILTSNFYKLQMIPACPEDKTLDLKKTSYKKLKPFLDYMCKENLLTIKEAKKGVESITAINRDHPSFSEFYLEPANRPKVKVEEENNDHATNVTESYVITQVMLPLFSDSNLRKGDTVQHADIYRHVTDFVRKHQCQDETNQRFVKPKGALVGICGTENLITREELMEKVCAAMKSCYKVSSGAETTVNKGKVSPINISVSQRAGNKKVTLVDNLELFGINIGEFAKECQHGVAASTSISKLLGKKCDQLLVQGNQVNFVYKLLTEKYKIPQKYVKGLENAPKKKK